MADAYWKFSDEKGFSTVIDSRNIIEENDGNLSVQLYVNIKTDNDTENLEELLKKSKYNQKSINEGFEKFISKLKDLGI